MKKWRKLLALLLTLCMFATALPALAEEEGTPPAADSGSGGGSESSGGGESSGGDDKNPGGNDSSSGGDSGGWDYKDPDEWYQGDPDNGNDTPDDGNDTPDDGNDTPDGGDDNPDGGDDWPGDGDDYPDDGDDYTGTTGDVTGAEQVTAPKTTMPPMDVLLKNYLGDYNVVSEGEEPIASDAVRAGATPEDAQIVRDANGAAAEYRLMPITSEGALLVEAADVSGKMTLKLRLSQVRRFTQELGIRSVYFRSGNATVYVPLEGLMSGDPAKLVRLLTETYAEVALENLDFSETDFDALSAPSLSEEELRGYYFEISIAPAEAGYEINVALNDGKETLDIGFVKTNVQLCIHGEGNQLKYVDLLFGMEENLNTARGYLPSVSEDIYDVFTAHFDGAAPWAEMTKEKLTERRVGGMVVGYTGYGVYAAEN